MQIVNQADLSPEAHAALAHELPRFGTLEEFVAWGRAQRPPALLLETIAQDEFTHDVIVPWRDGLTLVLSAT